MEKENDLSRRQEWAVTMPDESSKIVSSESRLVCRVSSAVQGLIIGFMVSIWKFLEKAWKLAVSEPRKVIHCIKVGVALAAVSLVYFVRPLYDGYGSNALWAIMTVVVVFEQTVGATLSKCINRVIATFVAGSLGIGVHWVAHQSGKDFEPIILGLFVFLFASAATFSRFIPSVKERFDYGALIFILTFSLVSVSGYRIDKLLETAHQRLSTIAIGTSLCIIVSMFICPIWAGDQLHYMIHCNLDKLANSLERCAVDYLADDKTDNGREEATSKKTQVLRSVLNSKASEESLANFARWEPAHGRFNFRHPWKQYLNLGISVRNCAYNIETLNSCISSNTQAPDYLKKHFSRACMALSLHSSNLLKELEATIKTMETSTNTEFLISEVNLAVLDLKAASKALPNLLIATSQARADKTCNENDEMTKTSPAFEEVLGVATFVSLQIEVAARIQEIVNEIEELARLAEFKPTTRKKSKESKETDRPTPSKQGLGNTQSLQQGIVNHH